MLVGVCLLVVVCWFVGLLVAVGCWSLAVVAAVVVAGVVADGLLFVGCCVLRVVCLLFGV